MIFLCFVFKLSPLNNIVNRTGATAIAVKGMNGVLIYNNTFYSDQIKYTTPDKPGTWRGPVGIYSNTDITPSGTLTATKVRNNIFYTKNQIYNIMIYDAACLDSGYLYSSFISKQILNYSMSY